MARIVIGNRDGTLAVRHGRTILERLAEEWPDLQLTVKTVTSSGSGTTAGAAPRLLDALTRNAIDVAVVHLAGLTEALPAELTLAAVTRRSDQRSALVAKGYSDLAALPQRAVVGVGTERDATFLAATHPGLTARVMTEHPETELARLTAGDYAAVILPAATLIGLDLREHVDEWLEPDAFTPAAGQGAVGLVVRADDDLAFESVYPLQHRPSFDRVRAERAFAGALSGHHVGAAATVTDDGELTLFGAVAAGSTVVQGSVGGEAREAEELGKELAADFSDRLKAYGSGSPLL
jgi:hydroxymethylbilane synthase